MPSHYCTSRRQFIVSSVASVAVAALPAAEHKPPTQVLRGSQSLLKSFGGKRRLGAQVKIESSDGERSATYWTPVQPGRLGGWMLENPPMLYGGEKLSIVWCVWEVFS